MRRTMIGIAAATLALAACGSSGGGDAAPEATTATTTAAATATTAAAGAATTAAATATTAAGTATTKAATATTSASGGGSAAAAASTVTLKEFTVAVDSVKAGPVTIDVKNEGEFPHELIIIKADSFASLAKDSSGGVDESKATIVAQTQRIQGGSSEKLSATLEAGKYVFVCNLGQGANNHAVKGQHLDVTVS